VAGKQAKIIGDRELKAVLGFVARDRHAVRDRAIVLLSVKAGLRAAEIAKLEWSMVLDARGRVADTMCVEDVIAKSRAGRRVPLHPDLREALTKLLRQSADVFAIELLDMKLHHRVLYGTDFLADFEVPLQLHRLQVERELRTDWLRLRQAVLSAPLSNKVHLDIMLKSVSPLCALFRHALLALGHAMPATKREALDVIAALTGANPTAFQSILDVREGKRKVKDLDVEATLNAYLELVGVVTNEVDRRLGVA